MFNWLIVHSQWWFKDFKLLIRRSFAEFADDRCTQIAASISYYVFFSIFPLSIFLVTVFGQVLRNEDVKMRVLNGILDILPLTPGEGRDELNQALDGVSADISLLGLFSIVGLIWSASAMMAALRGALNIAWDTDHRRTALRGKLLDIVMVLIVGLLVAISIVATALRPYLRRSIDDVTNHLSLFGQAVQAGLWAATYIVPILVSLLIFAALYRFVPAVKTSFDEIWPGAVFAAIAFELAKVGFSFYIRNFGNYNAIYGSLGAVVVFMLFIFIAANILLMGAEIASEWPRIRAGHYDSGEPIPAPGDRGSIRKQLGRVLREALMGPEAPPEHVEDAEIDARTQRRNEAKARQIERRREARSGTDESET